MDRDFLPSSVDKDFSGPQFLHAVDTLTHTHTHGLQCLPMLSAAEGIQGCATACKISDFYRFGPNCFKISATLQSVGHSRDSFQWAKQG